MTEGPGVVRPPVDGPCRAAFTTRTGGVSTGPFASLNVGGTVADDPAAVSANRAAVCAALGLDPAGVVAGTQVHGAHVRRVAATDAAGRFLDAARPWPDGDGLTTAAPGCGLAVFGADCLPVLLWRRDRPAIAAVHAGWRGLVLGAVEAAVAALGDPASTGVAIGPGIGPCCYPVSDEVRDHFRRRFGQGIVRGRAVDLAAAAAAALGAAGVPESAVWTLATCTSCEPERWFSFRRDGARTGRQAGLIWIPAEPGGGSAAPGI